MQKDINPGLLFEIIRQTFAFKAVEIPALQDKVVMSNPQIVESGLIGVVLYCNDFFICVMLNNKLMFMRYEQLVDKCKKI